MHLHGCPGHPRLLDIIESRLVVCIGQGFVFGPPGHTQVRGGFRGGHRRERGRLLPLHVAVPGFHGPQRSPELIASFSQLTRDTGRVNVGRVKYMFVCTQSACVSLRCVLRVHYCCKEC